LHQDIRILWKSRTPPTVKGESANPITLAVILGYDDIFKVLLHAGATMDMVYDSLKFSASYGQKKIARYIQENYPSIGHEHRELAEALSNAAADRRNGGALRTLLVSQGDTACSNRVR
jgi:hypothetical protein